MTDAASIWLLRYKLPQEQKEKCTRCTYRSWIIWVYVPLQTLNV